jgi:hypothetical protein
MTTAANAKNSTVLPDFEGATERVREANDRLAEVGRKVTGAYLDGVENYVSGVAQLERKIGTHIKVDAIASLLQTHADQTEAMTKVSLSAARDLITA